MDSNEEGFGLVHVSRVVEMRVSRALKLDWVEFILQLALFSLYLEVTEQGGFLRFAAEAAGYRIFREDLGGAVMV